MNSHEHQGLKRVNTFQFVEDPLCLFFNRIWEGLQKITNFSSANKAVRSKSTVNSKAKHQSSTEIFKLLWPFTVFPILSFKQSTQEIGWKEISHSQTPKISQNEIKKENHTHITKGTTFNEELSIMGRKKISIDKASISDLSNTKR